MSLCNKPYLIHLLIFLLAVLTSCGSDEMEEENCANDLIGLWEVTDFTPTTSNCDDISSYQIGTTEQSSIFSLTIINGDQTLIGSGLIDADCTQLTYTVSQGQTISSGDIRFSGDTFEDRSDFGCLVNAIKR